MTRRRGQHRRADRGRARCPARQGHDARVPHSQGTHFFRLIHALQATARLLNQARNLKVAEIERAEADLAAFPQPEAMPARIQAAAARARAGGERSVSSVTEGGADRGVVPGRRDPGAGGPPVVPYPVRRRRRGRCDWTDDRARAGISRLRQPRPRAESQRHRVRKVGARGRSPP